MEKSIFSDDYLLFLRQLREARKKAGLTQQQLAERLQQTQSFVSKCERGERRLDLVETRAFCNAIGVSFTTFIMQFDSNLAQNKEEASFVPTSERTNIDASTNL